MRLSVFNVLRILVQYSVGKRTVEKKSLIIRLSVDKFSKFIGKIIFRRVRALFIIMNFVV